MDGIKHVDQLLALDGEEFVDGAYRTLLKRAADQSGRAHFIGRLRAGDGKVSVLAAIAASPEAQAMRTSIEGIGYLLQQHAQNKKSKKNDFGRLEREFHRLEFNIGETNRKIQHRLEELQINTNDIRSAISGKNAVKNFQNENINNKSSADVSIVYKSIKADFHVASGESPEDFLNNLQNSILRSSEGEILKFKNA